MHSNSYTFLYSIGLSIITAIVLVVTSESLKPAQVANLALDQKKNILHSVRIDETDRKKVEEIYSKQVKELTVDSKGNVLEGINPNTIVLKEQVAKPADERKLPLYIYTKDDGSQYYIIPLTGVGLWGPIWGYISIESDFDTVYGSYFDHKSETPGLGAEIAEKPFQERFEGKKIMNGDNFVSVHVLKTTAKADYGTEHRVDAISGGTITSNGVDKMIANCIQPYVAYFQKIKNNVNQ